MTGPMGGRLLHTFRRAARRLSAERGSAYLEYCLLTSLVFLAALAAFSPGSFAFRALGADFAFRQLLMRLPIF